MEFSNDKYICNIGEGFDLKQNDRSEYRRVTYDFDVNIVIGGLAWFDGIDNDHMRNNNRIRIVEKLLQLGGHVAKPQPIHLKDLQVRILQVVAFHSTSTS